MGNVINRCKKVKGQTRIRIAEIIFHENFYRVRNAHANGMVENDVALLKTEEALTETAGLRTVCLPNVDAWGDTFEREYGRISGWGQKTKSLTRASCDLQLGSVQILPRSSPSCKVGFHGKLSPLAFC